MEVYEKKLNEWKDEEIKKYKDEVRKEFETEIKELHDNLSELEKKLSDNNWRIVMMKTNGVQKTLCGYYTYEAAASMADDLNTKCNYATYSAVHSDNINY